MAYHHGNLREALIDAALQLVESEGPEGFTLREVARLAGVSHAAPYRHFPSRAAILAALAERGVELLASRLDQVVTLEELLDAYLSFFVENAAYYQVLSGRELAQVGICGDLAAGLARVRARMDAVSGGPARGLVVRSLLDGLLWQTQMGQHSCEDLPRLARECLGWLKG